MTKVSMVMPTYNRSKYIATAIRSFMQQTHDDKELIIVDDGTETFMTPDDARIRHIKLSGRAATGTKRNIGAEAATGEIIASLDDDDWSHAHRITDQYRRLHSTGKAVTGYNSTVSYDEATGAFYKNLPFPPYYASGTSQMYWKSWWKQHPFPDCKYGEDSVFSRTARLADQLSIGDPGVMLVARKHAGNTAHVLLGNLPKIASDPFVDFLHAIKSPLIGSLYMTEPHVCTDACRFQLGSQYSSLIAPDYKAAFLPEVRTL